MIRLWIVQILSVLRLEMRKTFLARRGLWVYLLALAPVVLFAAHSINAPRQQARLMRIAAQHPVSKWALLRLRSGMSRQEVIKRLGEPYSRNSQVRPVGRTQTLRRDVYHYTDGNADVTLVFFDEKLVRINFMTPRDIDDDSTIFATIFQFYYLRLAVFFGCVGVFTNLFRGEMIDKSLHFYLLTPMRREVLLAGKYLSGLIATVVIFSGGTALQLLAMLWQYHGPIAAAYLHGAGWGHIAGYLGVTALACAGYGAVFLAAGLVFRNPIIPAAIVLVWESANVFVPAALKKLSLIYYLQSLCPVVAEPQNDMSMPLRLLLSASEPPGTGAAICGIGVVTLSLLIYAAWRARKLEINYGTE
jgi:ABC-type transport system involved in multi-copper enzyme maturation permease subunit